MLGVCGSELQQLFFGSLHFFICPDFFFYVGGDATTAFAENGHSQHAHKLLKTFQVGRLTKRKLKSSAT